MDWIEKLFHLNLDGGSGAAEIIVEVVAVAAVVAVAWRRVTHQS